LIDRNNLSIPYYWLIPEFDVLGVPEGILFATSPLLFSQVMDFGNASWSGTPSHLVETYHIYDKNSHA